jgi:hypothetical protein
MRIILILLILHTLIGCSSNPHRNTNRESIEYITETNMQSDIFIHLLELTHHSISKVKLNDSLAFLILPLHASCPACRNKTIDSIVKYKDNLTDRQFIVIAADGGRKIMASYFKEQEQELPTINNKLFLDSTNVAYKHHLFDKKPTIYYASNGKVYKKVSAIPSTIKQDLHEFFFH